MRYRRVSKPVGLLSTTSDGSSSQTESAKLKDMQQNQLRERIQNESTNQFCDIVKKFNLPAILIFMPIHTKHSVSLSQRDLHLKAGTTNHGLSSLLLICYCKSRCS